MSAILASRDVAVAAPARLHGCFTASQPEWSVTCYAEAPTRHKLVVGDADDQSFDVTGAPELIGELFALLSGVGPLTRADVHEACREAVTRGARWA